MHETSVIAALVEQVCRCVPDGSRVRGVLVEVGGLEHLDDIVMQTAWRALTTDGPVGGAVLTIAHAPVRIRCRECEHEYEPGADVLFRCPACGRARPELAAGSGVTLRSIEIEDD